MYIWSQLNYILLFFLSDVDIEIYITRKNQTTSAVTKEEMAIEIIGGRSALNNSAKAGISFKFNDSIGIDVHMTIISSTPFSVFLALPTTDSCSNYEAIARLGCNDVCSYQECVFQFAELDGYYDDVVYCRYKCQKTSVVLIRRMVGPGMQYLPANIRFLELAALAI